MSLLAFTDNLLVLNAVVFAAVVALILATGDGIGAWFARRRARARAIERQLRSRGTVTVQAYGPPIVGLGIFVVGVMLGMSILAFVVGILVFKMLDGLPALNVRRRHQRFDEQLPDALTALSHSLKAGLSLPQAVGLVARDLPVPVREEFAEIEREYEMGKPIEQAMDDARDRVRSRNFELAVTAFQVGKQQGGNLAEVFEKIGESIREIWRLEEHIRTVSTQGRSSARFMTFMPGVFLILLYFMDSESTMLLFSDPIGLAVLSIVLVLNVIGHIWIRGILNVDV